MKRVFILFLCCLCIFSFTACKNERNPIDSGANSENTQNQGNPPGSGPNAENTQTETELSKLEELFWATGSGGNRYFGEDVTFVKEKGYDKQYWYTPLKLKVREINISDIGLDETITIGAISDTHLCSNPEAIDSFTDAMQVAQLTDSVAVCGDIAENFRSETNVNIFKKYFSQQFKDALCVVGNHDRYSADFAENDEFIKNIWPHNHIYYSKTVKDKIVLVGVDNSYETFYTEQCEALSKEIENARKKGQIILFVCHVPLNMLDCSSGVNKQMCDLLTTNTDVVKLVLAGHAHGDSKTMLGDLPVYTLEGTGHDRMNRNVLIITIK